LARMKGSPTFDDDAGVRTCGADLGSGPRIGFSEPHDTRTPLKFATFREPRLNRRLIDWKFHSRDLPN
jgi:hypothetical protein